MTYLGEIFSLLSAMLWGLAVVYYKKAGDTISPVALNPFKTIVGYILFLITGVIIGQPILQQVSSTGISQVDYFWLILSGAIGIGIADAIFFKSLNILGAGISAIVDCLYSPSIIMLAFFLLGERLTLLQIVGFCIMIGAILFATLKIQSVDISRKQFGYGVFLAGLSFVLMGLGVIWIKPLLENYKNDTGMLIWISGFRLLPGIIVSLIIFFIVQIKRDLISPFKNINIWPSLLKGSIIGSFVAVTFWMIGMSHTTASIASILNQTASFFLFIFAWLILKEPITKGRVISLVISIAGVSLVLIG